MIFKQIVILLWKNALIRIRKPFLYLFLEYGVIVSLFISILILKLASPFEKLKNKYVGPKIIDLPSLSYGKTSYTVGYVPESTAMAAFLRQIKGKEKSIKYKGYPSEKQLLEAHEKNNPQFHLALMFQLRPASSVSYEIRDIEEIVIRPFARYEDKGLWFNIFAADGCRKMRFVGHTNDAVSVLYTFLKSALNVSYHNFTIRTEDISCMDVLYTTPFKLLVAAIIITSFLIGSWALTFDLIQEKNSKLKKSVKWAGVNQLVLWVSSLLFAYIRVSVVAGLVTWLLYSLGRLDALPGTDPIVMFALVLTYGLTTVSLSFSLSDFSRDVTTAAMLTLIWNIGQIGYVLYRMAEKSTFDHNGDYYAPFFIYWTLVLACHLLIELNKSGKDLNWNLILHTRTSHMTLVRYFTEFLCNIIFYMVAGLVFRSLLNYVNKLIRYKIPKEKISQLKKTEVNSDSFFMEQSKVPVCIEYRCTNKSTDQSKFQVYKKQITVVLGHPHSGKSKLIATVTGLKASKTSQNIMVRINGERITSHDQLFSHDVQVCLQHNALIGALSVYENLYFYSALRGYSKSEINPLINDAIENWHLHPSVHEKAGELPNFRARIFNLVLVLIENPPILILDEPDKDLTEDDVDKWLQFAQSKLLDRTVLLTTSSPITAMRLANNIAVIADGQILCFGKVPFIETLFGSGYQVSITLGPESDVEAIGHYIHLYIETYSVQRSNHETLEVVLPETYTPLYEFLLANFMSKGKELGVHSFLVERVHLRDIFSKLYNPEVLKGHLQVMSERRSTLEIATLLDQTKGPKKLYSTLSESFKECYSATSLWSVKDRESSTNWLVSSFKNMSSYLKSNSTHSS
ncbi:ATP-binding cassette sub-family A member 17-like isoform X2 [Biomphalaria glabrata]|uniref:ATP-binding cassette sub-family A member 17-like isoform X2 n=2 Tax=Biomphalaria glabrata TaxID=6526 RepID=A0A9W3A389_BIOGL|nr:ATP-binding cassette sub-family A member 17-like isoform X2 [Biomphalaria glabrata]